MSDMGRSGLSRYRIDRLGREILETVESILMVFLK